MLSSSSREGAQGTTIYTYDYKVCRILLAFHMWMITLPSLFGLAIELASEQRPHIFSANADRHHEREETHSVHGCYQREEAVHLQWHSQVQCAWPGLRSCGWSWHCRSSGGCVPEF